ncbi:hypothetical protein [Brevundimonas pishanensis]|uniref:hypothetical protein n=1 Tax=Brevundimonas pishanensis TaxID=2896315 RepID=UPI001FA72AB0|nr:hypothetical protein [Brevundimonas pishanensis]
MKSAPLALGAAFLVIATPALAASGDDGTNPAVWIAIGAAFMGAFTAIIGGLAAAKAKKKKLDDK